MDGEPLTDDHVGGTIALLLIAGIDTTWCAIGASLWHLATHPDDRQRLVDEPELLPIAIEEFLRAYAPVTMARLVKEDLEIGGCPMKAEDWVLLPFPAANRDPEAFDRADEVIIDRERNRHAAFGARHPSLRRVEPGPHGAAGGPRGVARAHPRLRAGRSRGRPLVHRPGPGSATAPGAGADDRSALMRIAVRPDEVPGPRPLLRAGARAVRLRRRGLRVVLRPTTSRPTRKQAARLAADNCPEFALTIEE